MSSVAVTIQERIESGQSPSKICDLLKGRASRSGAYKVLKSLKETGSSFPKMRSSRKVRTPKLIKNIRERRLEVTLEEACKNWLLILV